MKEQLRASSPNRYDKLIVHFIDAHIKIVLKDRRAAFVAAEAAAAAGSAQPIPATEKTHRYIMAAEYAETLKRLSREQPQTKPGAVNDKLWTGMGITAGNEPADLPTENQLKSKLCSMRSKLR